MRPEAAACALEAIEQAEFIGSGKLFYEDFETGTFSCSCGLGHIYKHCIDPALAGIESESPTFAYDELAEFFGISIKPGEGRAMLLRFFSRNDTARDTVERKELWRELLAEEIL
jgi:hypothetical protein